jgi:hypothetical protein
MIGLGRDTHRACKRSPSPSGIFSVQLDNPALLAPICRLVKTGSEQSRGMVWETSAQAACGHSRSILFALKSPFRRIMIASHRQTS